MASSMMSSLLRRCSLARVGTVASLTHSSSLALYSPPAGLIRRSFSAHNSPSPPKQEEEGFIGSRFLPPGMDFKHWIIIPVGPHLKDSTRNQVIDFYVKLLAQVVGSEEEAKKKIYSVSTFHPYFGFRAEISEELVPKLKALPNVTCVLPDVFSDPKTKTYGGEPFVNGQAAPWDPKYMEPFLKNRRRIGGRIPTKRIMLDKLHLGIKTQPQSARLTALWSDCHPFAI